MKKFFFLFAFACMFAAVSFAAKNPVGSFDGYSFDFGRINAREGAVCHSFRFTNTSDYPVSLAEAIPGCSCIYAILPSTPVLPHQMADVLVVFNPVNSVGKNERSVEILDSNRLSLGALSISADVSDGPEPASFPFRNPDLSFVERVENLISLLSPDEKVGLMMNKSVSIDRLLIPSYNWWSEACHGVRQDGYTVFPQPIGLAAAFSPSLVFDVFSAVSTEARANWNRSDHNVFNVGMGEIYYPGNPELSFWCPNVNIFRDPRWGRGQETCGEDPFLNAVLGVETVKGMQGDHYKYFKTHACAKHYAVHSGPEPLRHSFNASVSMRDLWETYLPAFNALVKKANVREVMCAYNRYEGSPCCMSDRLLIDILRRKWGFDAIVLTDCDAINNFFNKGQHETHSDPVSASVDAVLNGTDLECGKVFVALSDALRQGKIDESVLDSHLRKTLMGRFELGMFDPVQLIPWSDISPDAISSDDFHRLAVQAARESIVLLENNNVLPLSKSLRKIAVVGPNADDTTMLNGNYGGTPIPAHSSSLLQGIRNAFPLSEIFYSKACELNDDFQTIPLLKLFNDGKGALVEFFSNQSLEGEPAAVGNYEQLNFSTFGAWGFADGVGKDSLSVRVSGSFKAPFSGDVSYYFATDNGYVLSVDGVTLVDSSGSAQRPSFGFPHSNVNYATFPVVEGKTYDVVLEYRHGNANFALLRGEFCRRIFVEFSDLARNVADADAIIVIGGISPQMEGEGGDKANIELPPVQQRLLHAMHATGKPVIMVNCSGSAIAFGSVDGDYDALVQAWYPGEGGAQALADVLSGEFNPSGKLPVTFYRSDADLPDFLDYSMDNRTYRYFNGSPQYPFGYGLSYSNFVIGNARLSRSSMKADGSVTLSVPVKNVGDRPGSETVQVYVKALDYPDAPIKSLKGFSKIYLKPGESRRASISLDAEAFEFYDPAIDELSPRPGRYAILYGNSSSDSDLRSIPFTLRP